jgi:hypothetical protein
MAANPNPTDGKGIRDAVAQDQETYDEWRKHGIPGGKDPQQTVSAERVSRGDSGIAGQGGDEVGTGDPSGSGAGERKGE